MLLILFDSPASAGFLKNSVRVGDRSAMTIIRPPADGERRLGRTQRSATRGGAAAESQEWFWRLHDPKAPASPARWQSGVASLKMRRSGGKAMFSESGLRDIAGQYGTIIAKVANVHGLSETLILAVIAVESAGQSRAVSVKGAQGLMQLIPATARRFGVADSFDPNQNIAGGAAYLDWLLREFDNDVFLALAGYNAGEGAVGKHRGVPPYAETRDYVVKVLDALVAAEALCAPVPQGPRHRCRWQTGLSS